MDFIERRTHPFEVRNPGILSKGGYCKIRIFREIAKSSSSHYFLQKILLEVSEFLRSSHSHSDKFAQDEKSKLLY